jgi:2-methylcitrate dehydratase PrpD
MSVTMYISEFTANMHFDDLPPFVVDETKSLLLDTIGCALGAVHTRKGEIAIQVARALGGTAQSSLLGTHEKVSAASSSFATGELMNALDYEALLSPPDHATPYVLPAPLAIGEMRGVSGRELIVATALFQEMTHSKLVEKFRANTRSILGEEKMDKALTFIKSMDDIADIRELFACITPA